MATETDKRCGTCSRRYVLNNRCVTIKRNGPEVVTPSRPFHNGPLVKKGHVMAIAKSTGIHQEKQLSCSVCGSAESEIRNIVGFDGLYTVSDIGTVRSVYSDNKIRKQQKNAWGYATVGLSINKTQKIKSVHRLVIEAFHGPQPAGMISCHGVHGKVCNCVGNLSWGSASKNNGEDRRRDGTIPIGTRTSKAVFSEEDIHRVRGLHKAGMTQNDISILVGSSRAAVCDVLIGKCWAWLPVSDYQPSREEMDLISTKVRPPKRLTEQQMAEAVEMYRSGMSIAGIGRRFDVYPKTFTSRLKFLSRQPLTQTNGAT